MKPSPVAGLIRILSMVKAAPGQTTHPRSRRIRVLKIGPPAPEKAVLAHMETQKIRLL